jgi:hypothetical protein
MMRSREADWLTIAEGSITGSRVLTLTPENNARIGNQLIWHPALLRDSLRFK